MAHTLSRVEESFPLLCIADDRAVSSQGSCMFPESSCRDQERRLDQCMKSEPVHRSIHRGDTQTIHPFPDHSDRQTMRVRFGASSVSESCVPRVNQGFPHRYIVREVEASVGNRSVLGSSISALSYASEILSYRTSLNTLRELATALN